MPGKIVYNYKTYYNSNVEIIAISSSKREHVSVTALLPASGTVFNGYLPAHVLLRGRLKQKKTLKNKPLPLSARIVHKGIFCPHITTVNTLT